MLVVKIELWPWGEEARKRQLATIAIANTGAGNVHIGDYRWVISHQQDSGFGPSQPATPHELMKDPSLGWKSGSLEGFTRRRGAVALVKAVLAKAFKR